MVLVNFGKQSNAGKQSRYGKGVMTAHGNDPAAVAPERDVAQELMLAFQAGDEASFDKLVKFVQRDLFSLAYRYGLDDPTADDVIQETMLRVYLARKRYQPHARFRAWLMRIATNLIISRARKNKRRPKVKVRIRPDSQDPAIEIADTRLAEPAEHMAADECAQAVRDALDELPDTQRMALILNRFQHMSYEEVGAALGLKVPAVKSLLFRARQNLKERLHKWVENGNETS